MKSDLKKGPQSNYLFTLHVDPEDKQGAKQKVLKEFQKEVRLSGFRKGHVPLSIVEKQVKPEYLTMSIYERLMTEYLQNLVSEKKDMKFIGSPYDINFEDKDETTLITFALDVYPEVDVNDAGWEKLSIKAISPSVSAEEKKKSLMQFKKQYAEYKDIDAIEDMTVTKVQYRFLNKEKEEVGKSVLYVGDEEAEQHPWLKETFWGKKGGEEVVVPYDEKKLPHIVHIEEKEGKKPSVDSIVFLLGDVKKIVLPAFDEAKIKTIFGDDAKVRTEKEIETMIEETMKEEKFKNELMQSIEKALQDMMKKTLRIAVPKTMVEQEQSQRLKNMQERFGGKESFDHYVKQLGDDKYTAMLADIKKAAKESLEKFLVFRKLIDLHTLEVNREEELDAEYKLYEKITGEKPFRSAFLETINAR